MSSDRSRPTPGVPSVETSQPSAAASSNRPGFDFRGRPIRPIGTHHRLTLPMIDRPPRRIIPHECLGCGLSDVACAATRDLERRPCCDICKHEPN